MTCPEFYSFIKKEFIKDQNFILIDRIQQITSPPHYGTFGTGEVAFCEIILHYSDQRNIIRFISNILSDGIDPYLKIELISITLASPSHPNLAGFFEAKGSVIFKGSMADENNPKELNTSFLMNILNNYHSFVR